MSTTDDPPTDIAAAFRVHSGKQQSIPGTERKYNDVERCAEDLREAERACKAATEIKATVAERLVYALIETGERSYKYIDSDGQRHTVTATSKTTVKVTRGWGEE